jgi:PAS domain S-box-containing protein
MPRKKLPKDKSLKTKKALRQKTASKRALKTVSKKNGQLEALQQNEERLLLALEAAHISIWEWDIITNEIKWSENVHKIFGLAKTEFKDTLESYMNLVHPDDRDHVKQTSENAILTHTNTIIEHRFIRPDGTLGWIESNGKVILDKNGKPVKMTGIAHDITSKKRIEQEREDWKTRLDLISSSAGLVIYDYDISSGEILWSGNSKEVLGYLPSELGNIDRWVELIHPDDRENAFRLLEVAQNEIKPYDVYYRFSMKNGQYCFMHDRGVFVAGSEGKAIRMLGMMSDVSERRNAEDALRESEQRFRILQEASFGGIGLHDHGIIIDCNQGLCDITGYSYKELIGRDGLELISPEWRDIVLEKIKTGYSKPYDVEGIRKDGTRYFLEVHGKEIPYHGRTIRVTEFRDITERKHAEEKIIEQNARLLSVAEDLRRKNNQLNEFTQIVSHNLRSPVGNILTLLDFYENAKTPEEKAEYFNLLKESSTTTLTMLNELNKVLQIKQSSNIEQHDLEFEQILQQVKAMLNAKITELDAEVISDFSQNPVIHYPGIYLESIMLNLLSNALKYHNRERRARIVFKTYQLPNGNNVMEVSDNGLGINLEKYGHQVFKLRKTFHRHPESRGIGLFMIKNQIEAMGGDISISSKENEGSTFLINFNKHHTDV